MERELRVAIDLARSAGRDILDVYRDPFEVVYKEGDAGPVTAADLRADQRIRRGLGAAFPGDAVQSEEGPVEARRRTAERLWLVDPLDGTRHFVQRDGQFAVMIGLARAGRPVLGVIHLPVDGETYAGGPGLGVFLLRDENADRREITLCPFEDDGVPRIAVSRASSASATRRALAPLANARLIESGSIGRKAAQLLAGRVDAYVTLGRRSHHWDSCAPDALIRAAGGFFGDARGEPIDYRAGETRNAFGLVGSRLGLDRRIIAVTMGPACGSVGRVANDPERSLG